MSKISNTTAYPTVTPAAGDLLVITDVSDSNATKTATVSSVTSSVLGLQTQEITLTPAQLLSLNGGGSVELIAAPGEGKVIQIISYASFLDFNTTAYNFSGTTIGLFYSGGTDANLVIQANVLNVGLDSYYVPLVPLSATSFGIVNDSIVFRAEAITTVTTGDSPLTLSILYRIVDFS